MLDPTTLPMSWASRGRNTRISLMGARGRERGRKGGRGRARGMIRNSYGRQDILEPILEFLKIHFSGPKTGIRMRRENL